MASSQKDTLESTVSNVECLKETVHRLEKTIGAECCEQNSQETNNTNRVTGKNFLDITGSVSVVQFNYL